MGTQNCCGYGKPTQKYTPMIKDYPERATIQRNRRKNGKTNPKLHHNSSLLSSDGSQSTFEDEKVNQSATEITVIDPDLFRKFDQKTKDVVFGYIRSSETILNNFGFGDINSDDSSDDLDLTSIDNDIISVIGLPTTEEDIRIPNNVHYLVLLYYYLMENEFEDEALLLWNLRFYLSDFMSTTLKTTRERIWDKFDRHSQEMISTAKYLPKFVYTISVLYIKSNQRKSVPPRYTNVKNCCKYMALLMTQSLPADQKKYMDKQHFVDNIHVYLSKLC